MKKPMNWPIAVFLRLIEVKSMDESSYRQVVLDTETTGMRIEDGNRIIEIGCVELINRQLTKRIYHQKINPEREVEEGAAEVHGMTWSMLEREPLFADIVDDFLDFIRGSELIIHNADFDVGFLNMELARLGRGTLADYTVGVINTLDLAKAARPGQRNNLNALCTAFGIDLSKRTLHGAHIDAELLSHVYLALTRGQESLDIATVDMANLPPMPDVSSLPVIAASGQELLAHAETMAKIDKESKGNVVWKDALSQTSE